MTNLHADCNGLDLVSEQHLLPETGPGLSAAEVAECTVQGQVNRTPRSDWAEYRDIAQRNLFTLFNALVAPAAVALFALGEYPSAWAVSAMGLVNTLIGLVQEVRAKHHLDRLAVLVEAKANVRREGQVHIIPAGEVVLGDHLLLQSGESILADGTLLAARFLEVDEALLTGESDPVPRHAGDRLLSGSVCVAGEGVYRADRVGGEAFAQMTSTQARRYHFSASPLQRSINRLIAVLSYTTVALVGAYLLIFFLRGFPGDTPHEREANLVKAIAATVTSMVPQGLVLMTTLAFILGAVRMSARGAVVQRLNAVESMASVDVLCMDKTGTLTTNRLELDQIRPLCDEDVRARLRLFAWASVDAQSKSIQTLRAALGPPAQSVELLDQLPFKSQNRYSAVRVRLGDAERVLILGACEALRPFLRYGDDRWEKEWKELLPTGLRLLMLAEGEPADEGTGAGALFEFHSAHLSLRPLALIALSDELRPDAGAVLEALAAQGISFKILSGDNPETVRATVAHLRLALSQEPVASGNQLAHADDAANIIAGHSVFGRIAPQQKLEIVAALQAQGRHVAMIGDGVNDVLSIKRADLGIAMGEGSSAARTVAGLVLENNRFSLLPATLEEGRIILRNLRSAGKLFLLKNVYTLLLILVGMGVLGLAFPYEPQQVTLLNALTIGGPTLVITLSRRPVRTPSRRTFLQDVGPFVLITGTLVGVAGLVLYMLAGWGLQYDEQLSKTLLLSTLVLLGLANLPRVMEHGEERPARVRWYHLWVLVAGPLYVAVMYLPWTSWFFCLSPLTWHQWGMVLVTVVLALLLMQVYDRLEARWKSTTSGR